MNLLKRVQNVLTGPAREATSWWPAGLAALAAPVIAALAMSGWSPLPATADDDAKEHRKAEERKIEELEREVREGLENLIRQAELKEAVELERKTLEEQLAANKKAAAKEADVDDEDGDDEDAKKDVVKKDGAKKDTNKGDAKDIPKKAKGGDDFNFADFKPQTDREERLVAVIKKLQAQLKESGTKKGASDPDYYESKRAVEAKAKQDAKQNYELEYRKQIEAAEKAALDKLETIRKKKESSKSDYENTFRKEVDAKAAAIDKEAAARKEKMTKEGYEKVPDKEAILRKAEKALAEAAKDSDGKAAMLKKMAAIKEKGIDKEGATRKDGEVKKKIPDDVESLRRALEEQEARLRKTQDALERLEAGVKKEGKPGKETKKKAPPKDDENPKQDPNKGEKK